MSYERVSDKNPFPDDDPPPYDDAQEPLLGDNVVVTRRSQRSVSGTLCSAIFIIPYLVLLSAPLFTIGFFASIQNAALGQRYSGCLLYATFSGSYFQLGQSGACSFTIFGEAAISVVGLILIVLTIVKTVWGKWFSPLMFCDLILLVLVVLLSFAVGVVLSIGFRFTCNALESSAGGGTCPYIYLGGTSPRIFIYGSIHNAEIASWIVFGAAVIILIIEIICTCAYCLSRRSTRTTVYNEPKDF